MISIGRSIALLELGARQQSDADVTVVLQLAETLHQPFYSWWATGQQVLRALLAGRLAEAEQYIYQQFQFGQQVQAPDTLQAFGIQMAILRNEQDRLQEMGTAFKEFVEQYPAVPAWRCGLAGLYRELELAPQAREVFEQIAVHNFTDLPQDQQWMTAMVLLADVCAFLRNPRRAALLYDMLLPYAHRVAIIGPGAACYGAVDRSLGLLAATQSRWEEASRHFEAAITMNARIGARLYVAWTQHDYAQMLLIRNQPGDPEQASQLLQKALATAQELGMKKLADNIQFHVPGSKLHAPRSESSSREAVVSSQHSGVSRSNDSEPRTPNSTRNTYPQMSSTKTASTGRSAMKAQSRTFVPRKGFSILSVSYANQGGNFMYWIY
jgi:tetratricopeptide (TPR) repeat protein